MSYLDKPLTKDGYFDHIGGMSLSYQQQSKYALDWFEKFCIGKFSRDTQTILSDSMKQKYADPQRHTNNLFSLLQEFVNYLGVEGKDPATIRTNFNLVKGYLNWYGFEIYTEFVRSRIKFPKKIEDEAYPLTLDDIKKILDASKNRKALYLFLSSSGMRIQETLKLRKRDFDLSSFDRIIVIIPGKYTKTKKPRRTFITKETENYLKPILNKIKDDDLVFTTNQDSNKAKHTEEEYFSRVREQAGLIERYDNGIHKITLHSFRSWFVTKCNRIDSDFGNALAGHAKYLKRYNRFTDQEKYTLYIKAETTLSIYERVDEDQQERLEAILKENNELREGKLNEIMKKEIAQYLKDNDAKLIRELDSENDRLRSENESLKNKKIEKRNLDN